MLAVASQTLCFVFRWNANLLSMARADQLPPEERKLLDLERVPEIVRPEAAATIARAS